jgi:hypothetical protein
MNWVRFFGYLVYAIVLASAAYYVVQAQRDGPIHYTTKTRLPLNHLMRAEDLKGEGAPVVGRYARGNISAGEDVTEAAFDTVPLLPGDETIVLVPVLRSLLTGGAIDAGSSVRICSLGNMVTTAHAVAGLCRTSSLDVCALAVDFDAAQRREFAAAVQAGHDSFRAAPQNAACP